MNRFLHLNNDFRASPTKSYIILKQDIVQLTTPPVTAEPNSREAYTKLIGSPVAMP